LEVGYVGAQSKHIDRADSGNLPEPGPGAIQPRRPYPMWADIRVIRNDVTSSYNSLQSTLRKRTSSGLTIIGTYAWSKTIDDGNIQRWFDTTAFARPRQFTYDNSGRNILRGPITNTFDFGLVKNFRVAERHNVQFRAEFFSLTNTPNFGLPGSNCGNTDFRCNHRRLGESERAAWVEVLFLRIVRLRQSDVFKAAVLHLSDE
jgi:hypothetical protein